MDSSAIAKPTKESSAAKVAEATVSNGVRANIIEEGKCYFSSTLPERFIFVFVLVSLPH
jgi:hypothetical protein